MTFTLSPEIRIQLRREVRFRTSRSSGSGGQHVNKVETRVELIFDVDESQVLTTDQKTRLFNSSGKRISEDGLLTLSCEETRSQAKNKEIVFERFMTLLENALKPAKKRKPTRPTGSSVEKRLKDKKKKSEKKEKRKKPPE
jgi:ribosome-associated protein